MFAQVDHMVPILNQFDNKGYSAVDAEISVSSVNASSCSQVILLTQVSWTRLE